LFAVKFFFTAKLAKNVAKNAKPNYAPSETEPLLEPLLTLAAAGQASLRSLTLKEHGRSSIVLHQTVYPHKK